MHLLFCFVGLTLLDNALMLSGWKQVGLLAATLFAMLLTAKLFGKSELRAAVTNPGAAQNLLAVEGLYKSLR